MGEKSVWVVSAGVHGEAEEYALENGRIGYIPDEKIGDLSGIVEDKDSLRNRVEETYKDLPKGARSNILGNLWALCNRMQKGDLVVLRLKKVSVPAVAVGEIISDYSYDRNVPELLRHGRKVKWLKKEIPRSEFDTDLLYSFGSLLSISRVNRPDAYDRVMRIVEGGVPSIDEEQEEEEERLDFEQLAKDEILTMIIREFKGHNLQDLVAEILRVKGYEHIVVSPPGPDAGVDILAGCEPMGFGEPRLCVQVKSGDAKVDLPVYMALKGTMEKFKAEYGLLVSWGGFTKPVENHARSDFFKIRLWGQKELLDELFDTYQRLPEKIKARLPLKRIWIPLPQYE